jgi:GNAT superfamily N-acetyltransferase
VRVVIRAATADDRGQFIALWAEHLKEGEQAGDFRRASARTMTFYLALFDCYVSGALEGIVLLHERGGVLLWGEQPASAFDTPGDKIAVGYGTYVVPEARGVGVGSELHEAAWAWVRAHGFTHWLGGYRTGNAAGMALCEARGGRPIEIVMLAEVQ